VSVEKEDLSSNLIQRKSVKSSLNSVEGYSQDSDSEEEDDDDKVAEESGRKINISTKPGIAETQCLKMERKFDNSAIG
jgi:hypothetical protein